MTMFYVYDTLDIQNHRLRKSDNPKFKCTFMIEYLKCLGFIVPYFSDFGIFVSIYNEVGLTHDLKII